MSRRVRAGIGAVLLLAVAVALAGHVVPRMVTSSPASSKREVAIQATPAQAAPVEPASGSEAAPMDGRDAEPPSVSATERAATREPAAEPAQFPVQPPPLPRPTTAAAPIDQGAGVANPKRSGGAIAQFAMAPTEDMAPTEERAKRPAFDGATPSSPPAIETGTLAPGAPAAAPEQAAIAAAETGDAAVRSDQSNGASVAESVSSDPSIRAEAATAPAELPPLPAKVDERSPSPLIVVAIDPPGPVAGLSPPVIAPRTEIKRQESPIVETPSPPRQAASATAPADQREIDQILSRARALMRGRDFRAARSLLELVIDASPEASFMIAQTFDRRQIKARRVRGVEADHLRARVFYERAAKGGIPGAAQSLSGLED